MASILDILRPAPHLEEIADQEKVNKEYKYWRIRIFYSMFAGYALYYLTRKSFTFAMPMLMQDLGLDKGDLGILASIWAIAYGLSKFANGIIADRSNPRYFMSIGLIMTGICNVIFGTTSSLTLFAVLWGLNGWFQGFGWPGCTRLLTHWYSQSERGRWWSFLNVSQNLGGILIPLLVSVVAQYFGWRMGMYLPGLICIASGFVLMNRLRDTPQSLGLPSIERFRNDYPNKQAAQAKERELTVREILFTYVLKNPYIWILAASYFFVYIIRTAVHDWSVLYFVEEKGYSQLGAGGLVMWFEAGGVCGNIVAGWTSDTIFKGRRGPINVLFSLFVTAVICAFCMLSASSLLIDSVVLFLIGFFIFGPQMLIGVAAAELSHKKAAATATGFIGWIAYAGAAVAGYPFGKIAEVYGWEGFFTALVVCGVASTLLLLPLWRVRNREDTIFKKRSTEQEALAPAPVKE